MSFWQLSHIPAEKAQMSLHKTCIIAHLISISKILVWDGESNLSHVILPRLSCEGCTLIVLELAHMAVK